MQLHTRLIRLVLRRPSPRPSPYRLLVPRRWLVRRAIDSIRLPTLCRYTLHFHDDELNSFDRTYDDYDDDGDEFDEFCVAVRNVT